MAPTVLINTRIFAGGADLTSAANKVELSTELEEKDVTTFQPEGSGGWKDLTGGLGSTSLNASGLWEAGDPGLVDDALWAQLTGRAPQTWTVCPVSGAFGALAYISGGLTGSYKLGDAVGEAAPWEASVTGSGLLLRGQVAASLAARSTAGSGTGIELGELTGGQRMYASLHVLSLSGDDPSVTVSVESSADDDWEDPTTRATFTEATSPGGQVVSVSGAVTDTWWRIAWDVSGTTPSVLFLATLAIG